eukprot:758496-Hanusia_phi.AAC.8
MALDKWTTASSKFFATLTTLFKTDRANDQLYIHGLVRSRQHSFDDTIDCPRDLETASMRLSAIERQEQSDLGGRGIPSIFHKSKIQFEAGCL